jgi:arginyl-tRNA synthetase
VADPSLLLVELLTPCFDGEDPTVRPSDRADYQANGVLVLAKRRGTTPRVLAADVLGPATLALANVATVEIAGPGFLNIILLDSFIEAEVNKLAIEPLLGVRTSTNPERVVVDYSAPNVAKEMHVGHLRSTVIGDALVRILTFVGHTVIRENHVGDWGTPFGMLIEHIIDLGEESALSELSATDLTTLYRESRAKFDASEEFQVRAQARVTKLQGGDLETLRLWKVLVDQSAIEFQRVYARLGVLLTVNDIVGESFYNPMLPAVLRDLDTLGVLSESDGAKVVVPGGFSGRDGTELPLIVQNSKGGANYATTDLATVRDRVDRLNATWLIYVVGAPQSQHLAMVWKVAENAGWIKPPARCIHVAFGSVLGNDRKMLRTRAGESLKLSELLDEALERAGEKLLEKSAHIVDRERATVSQAIGMGAIKYADLSNDRIKDYVFDWDRMLAFEGNTGPYLQYACARINSLLRKANDELGLSAGGAISIETQQERALALALLRFDNAVWDTIEKLAPHRLCTYLFDLAQSFTAFYDACPVLTSPEPVRSSRLALSELTARILRCGLDLLGIDSPERM